MRGSFARRRAPAAALSAPLPQLTRPPVDASSHFDGPRPPAPPRLAPRAILDPFQVYGQGERVLRKELRALDENHLRAIAAAYGIDSARGSDSREALAESIVSAVKVRANG